MQMMPRLVVRSMQCWKASAEACHGQGECSFECVGFDSWYRGQRGHNPAILVYVPGLHGCVRFGVNASAVRAWASNKVLASHIRVQVAVADSLQDAASVGVYMLFMNVCSTGGNDAVATSLYSQACAWELLI